MHAVTDSLAGDYLIGRPTTEAQNLEPVSFDLLIDEVFPLLDIQLLERFGSEEAPILQVQMDEGQADKLREQFADRLIVEPNADLELFSTGNSAGLAESFSLESEANAMLVPLDSEVTFQFRVRGEGGEPVAGATVYLIGSLWLDKGVTDDSGALTLTLFGGGPGAIRGLMVKPRDSYWSYWRQSPVLDASRVNEVALRRLEQHASVGDEFPGTEALGWGQRVMRLAETDSRTGKGIRIAIVDSGLDTGHADLRERTGSGFDFTSETSTSWSQDQVGHGTHVAGVIAGLTAEGGGIRGFAPEAEVFVYKVFPGGKFSHLIKSLDLAIQEKVDIVNLSLGSKTPSQLLEQKLSEARQAGVACIAAAGNSGGPVLYPAKVEGVLAVAAIGQDGSFLAESGHVRQVGEHRSEDLFTARFTCHGPEVGVCAPGVAVVSAVPGEERSYAAWDGTSMACPHVVGLAALILEENQEIRALTGSARVDALFGAIRASAQSLPGVPGEFQGAGLPRLEPQPGGGNGNPEPAPTDAFGQLARLLEEALAVARRLAQAG